MARKLQISPKEWEVFIDDFVDKIEVDDPDNPGEKILKDFDGCKAFEVNDETPADASTFTLKSVLLATGLKIGQLARKDKFDDAVYMVLRKALKGWKNVVDGNGKALGFSTKHIDFLPIEEATALSVFVIDKVQRSAGKTEEDRDLGNS
jgi:hypothetical protein